MKKSILRVLAMVLAIVLILATFASCGQQGEQGPAGPQGEQGVQGEKGDAGNGISSIIKTSTEGLVDTYTITFTDGETTTFTVTNGADGEQGIQGIQGVKGEDGHTPVITIQNGYWYIDGVNTNQSATGVSGATGNGISNIAKTSTEGLVDTYTITYTNGTTTTFTVTNGAQGIQGIQGAPGKDGHSPVITIQDGYWYIDGVNTNEAVGEGVKGDTGNGISSIEKTKTEGLVDTYTITFTDGTTTQFTVTNGADGNDGINGTNGKDGVDGEDGKDGKDGADGQTPYIKDGYWWIGDINTNVKAEGTDGKDGTNGTNGVDGEDGTDGITPQLRINESTNMWEVSYDKGTTWTSLNVVATGSGGEDGQDGDKGDKGDAGRGIKRMWLDAELHLWVEYDDGSDPVDLGYVGVTTTEPTPDPEPEITEPTIVVSSANASAGDNDVAVTIALKNNPGVALIDFKVTFDSNVLTLTDVTFNTDFGGSGTKPKNLSNPVSIVWYNGDDNSEGDMVFVTLTFSVTESASAGDADITVTYTAGGICDIYEEDVTFDIINGKITIS